MIIRPEPIFRPSSTALCTLHRAFIFLILAEYPETHIRIIDDPYEEQLHALLHGQLNVIVGALRHPEPSPDITQELLFSDQLNIVVKPTHRLARSRRITVNQLRHLGWIAPRENTPAREMFSEFFRREGVEPPEDVIECSSLVAVRGLLLESESRTFAGQADGSGSQIRPACSQPITTDRRIAGYRSNTTQRLAANQGSRAFSGSFKDVS